MKKSERLFRLLFLPSLAVIIWLSAFIGVFLKGSQMINGDGDLGRHITIGNYILNTSKIPTTDVFSHTMYGEILTPHEWLSQVLFAVAYRMMGLDGAIILAALVISLSFTLVYLRSSRNRTSFFSLLFVGALIVLTSAIHWMSRPHIFTFLLLALWMLVLENMTDGKIKQWFWMPIIMLVWVNLHGAFIAGFVTWLLYGVGLVWEKVWFRTLDKTSLPKHFWRYYLLGGVTALISTLGNPSGWGLWRTSIGYVANRYLVDNTVEYMSPDFHLSHFYPFLIFIILLFLVISLSNKKVRAQWLVPSAAWLAMALYSARNIPLFVVVSAPILVEGLEQLIKKYSEQNKIIRWFNRRDENLFRINSSTIGIFWPVIVSVFMITGLAAGIKFDKNQIGNRYNPEIFPVQAVTWLESNPQEGRMFNYFTWGGYLLYREWPDFLVFIDGQTDFYGEDLTREYSQVIRVDPNWKEILDKHNIDWIIIPVNELISRVIQFDSEWTVVYKDDTSLIAHRK